MLKFSIYGSLEARFFIMNKFIFSLLSVAAMIISGCSARFSPLSPELNQRLNNQNGKIEELKNNQNGIINEIGKIRNENELNARDIRDAQQGLINMKGNENSGIQILQGDGALVMVFSICVIGMMLIFYYRSKFVKAEKTSDILAQQIALHDDLDLNNKVFMAAINTDVEDNIYHTIVKNQVRGGIVEAQSMHPKRR